MLAKKYSYEAEQETIQSERKLHFAELKKDVEQDKCVLWSQFAIAFIAILCLSYGLSVASGTVLKAEGAKLLQLQAQELQLIERNKLLRLEVEQLKSPERIIGFAENQLGLATARRNIYVYPTETHK